MPTESQIQELFSSSVKFDHKISISVASKKDLVLSLLVNDMTPKDLFQMILRALLCCRVALFNSLISLAKKPFAALGVASCTNGERIRAQRTFFAKIDLVSVILIYVWGFDPFILL